MENGAPNPILSFGEWVQRRRKALELTQAELAQRVGCAVVTLKKIERDERKPSRQMAALLAERLAIPEAVKDDFLEMARGKFVEGAPAGGEALRIPPFLQPGSRPPGSARQAGADFVERQVELDRLGAYLEQVSAGSGAPVFILGDAGSGKTTLMAEFARRALERYPQFMAAVGQCNAQTGVGDPYRPFRDILGMLTGDLESGWPAEELTPEQARRIWSSIPDTVRTIAELGPNLVNILLPLAPLVKRLAPYLRGPAGWLDRLESAGRAVRSAQPEHAGLEQNQVLEEVTRVLREVAAHHPLLLLLDDLQWADDASINLLFHLCRRLAGSRILLVGAFRPGENAAARLTGGQTGPEGGRPIEALALELARQYGDIQINLNLANPSEGRAFVDALIDRQPNRLDDAFRESLFRQTQGQPLFTVEMLNSMQESGTLVRDSAGRWVESTQSVPFTLPARVEAVIEQRLGRLKPELVELLGAASVEGEVFTAEVVANLAGHQGLRSVLQRLSRDLEQRHGLIRELGEVQVGAQRLTRFQFRHLLFQEYLYGQLSPGEKRRLHRDVAQELEKIAGQAPESLDPFGPWLVHHFWLGEVWDKAADYALQMGKQARQRYAMREAIAYFEQALAAQRALAQQTGATDEASLAALLGWEEAAFNFKPYQEQFVQLSKAEEIARRNDDKPGLIQVLHWTANVYLARGLWTRAGPALSECLALAGELGNEQLSVRPVFFKGLMTSFADPQNALTWLDRAADLALKYGDQQIEAVALGTRGQVLAQLGEFAQSQEALSGAQQVAARLGSPLTDSDVDLLAAWSCLAMGQTEESLVFGERSVERAIATDNMDCICNGLACVGYGNLELQRIPEAIASFEKGIARSEVSGAMIPRLNGQAGLAMAQFFAGRAEAVEDLEAVVQNMHLYENEVGAANANSMLGRCLLQLGVFERAESKLNEAVTYYRRSHMQPYLARTLFSMADLLEKLGRQSEAITSRSEAEALMKSFKIMP